MKFTEDVIKSCRMCAVFLDEPACSVFNLALDHIERLQKRVEELEVQLKSKDIIINNQQGRLNYYATKDLLGDKNE